ncbi:50S ribosomal protein L11 methyltransferase [Leisingera daeponensis]|uniref:50S ribosomal protein L11 methyltransferase n=1 Tax=Leisingera daeponensis TaxID=405746 RepID=UPI001C961174|nr:50S ribosomal protein L11 methyltransferase [Leisingera daeponensis]MBY6057413.1 50S ribosomal protein L11 methyltransferase [Leisingera daeponensis]
MLQNQAPHPSQSGPRQDPLDADELVRLAKSQSLADGGVRTSEILADALARDSRHHEAQVLQERLHQMFVPRWHFPMLADRARNQAYARAIAAKLRPGDVVLDIGCGAGLTAMLAARAGAKHVYTCEQQPLIAQAAERVIAANGLSSRITVLPKWSHDIVIGEDMPEPADVVISEIVDTVLLGEGALATLTHAMAVLAKPEARAVPEQGTLLAQPVESRGLLDLWRPQEAEGFDLSAFHRFARVAQLTPNDLAACRLKPLAAPAGLFRFDFARPTLDPARVARELACTEAGTIHAVCASFEMQLAPGILVANGLQSGGHWGRTAYLLDQPVAAAAGDRLRVTAQHDAAQLSLSIDGLTPRAADAEPAALWMTRGWTGAPPVLARGGAEAPAGAAWAPPKAAPPEGGAQPYH